jgi:hypothetical protein
VYLNARGALALAQALALALAQALALALALAQALAQALETNDIMNIPCIKIGGSWFLNYYKKKKK